MKELFQLLDPHIQSSDGKLKHNFSISITALGDQIQINCNHIKKISSILLWDTIYHKCKSNPVVQLLFNFSLYAKVKWTRVCLKLLVIKYDVQYFFQKFFDGWIYLSTYQLSCIKIKFTFFVKPKRTIYKQ